MADVLLLVGKGKAESAIAQAARQVQVSLEALGLSVVVEQQSCLMSELATKVDALLTSYQRPKLLVSVGFTTGVTLGQTRFAGCAFVPVIPDVPGSATGPFEKSLAQLKRLIEVCDYAVVLDEPSRALIEYRVEGASGKVLLPDSLVSLRSLCQAVDPVSPTKILVSGHDFRFIGDAVAHLSRVPGVEVRLQKWELAKAEPNDAQKQDVQWADVVLAEWAGRNAVWFSRNLSEHQRLVVHLHGFEANAVWIDQLNFERVNQLVVVSDFYKWQLVQAKGWAEQKIRVIPNVLEAAVFARPKRVDAAFHLAMVGFTPLLKRADLALEVLRNLLEKDDRFVLHLRGEAPWAQDWLWNRRIQEADAFAELYALVGQDARLRERVVFEPYGSNVEAWLSSIGWIMSLSDRETFHLAAAEGMASGAVPVFLPRDGVHEIFSDRWVFDSPQAIADFIYMAISENLWQSESKAAQEYVARFDGAMARNLWQEVLV